MSEFPYLIAIALIEEEGTRAMPLGGKSLQKQLDPEISCHFIDEGIDTGPLVCRVSINKNIISPKGKIDYRLVNDFQAQAFVSALAKISKKDFKAIDTFFERSNLSEF